MFELKQWQPVWCWAVSSVLHAISVLIPRTTPQGRYYCCYYHLHITDTQTESQSSTLLKSPSRKGQSRSSGAFREGHGPPLSHGTNWEAMPPWTDMGQSSQGPLKGVSTLGQKPGPWDWAHLTRFCLLCRPWGIWIQFYFRKNSVSFSCAYSDWEEIADSDSGTDPLQIMVMFSAISTRGSSAH